MIPEIGLFSLILALLVALAQGILPLVGAATGWQAGLRVARPAAVGQFGLTTVAFFCLAWAFVDNDFSVLYVAANSHADLPAGYRFAAVWGGHEGSLLLWLYLLTAWSLAVALCSRQLPLPFVGRVLAVMGWISVGFLLFLLFLSNPFERLMPPAMAGRDLNPLLQDPGMIVHPPMLYMGYVGFSVAFAFAIAALLSGELDAMWARWVRPWTLAAWTFLTIGILLGSAWAYYVLGWGGWWFWDPVENASFMPWLAGTALIHSLIVTERRGAFRSWTVLLAICAFSLSILGTFLVRSGVLTSVHAFAVDPGRGLYILAFMMVIVGGSLALYAWRAPKVGLGGGFSLLSRESLLLSNNVVLTVAAGSVLLGTLYPVVLDVLEWGKISIGPPYFEAVFVPLMTPAIFLMGVGPVARWKQAELPDLARRLRIAFAISVATAVLLPLAMPGPARLGSPMVILGLWLAAWSVASAASHAWQRLTDGDGHWLRRLGRQPRAWYGMLLAHAGIGIFIAGVTLANGYEVKQELRLELGETREAGGYQFTFASVGPAAGPNYSAQRAVFPVTRNGKPVVTLYPEKRLYTVQDMALSQADIDSGFTRDLFVALGEPVGANAWTVRLQVKPFMTWIWSGCILMALGGLLAAGDKRYRRALEAQARTRDAVAPHARPTREGA
ncbi:heme lyase CcmF/NrfE family subunit [Achromobacter denitrificans]|uniref:Heme lyase CcmF/NrfE family subunit n=1 Tax=Achromobacter denitrificans TaxID=32002 RepID=A0A3R9GV64_ACHDE|nr:MULTISPECIES: heme lyase CcmF/NrfE family subunit [Achromobacter]MBV2162221.1 heme lyase CcmF/NrfE family subunit [Achromobacter denitrificans]MDF3861531.1 heme lyase CcmF/NrfE family subunit [Achromobacter denitrificans]MDF3940547.1 heme lyase CcmF/NrfE family subunit [Achromobacter denitrificans]MDX3880217.1 heme lyase CcmF/NrfE family subunit [Achromobacter sp.]MPT40734.1 heme lyase CcmF/NrfE family subunit [Achromobacter sp.]